MRVATDPEVLTLCEEIKDVIAQLDPEALAQIERGNQVAVPNCKNTDTAPTGYLP